MRWRTVKWHDARVAQQGGTVARVIPPAMSRLTFLVMRDSAARIKQNLFLSDIFRKKRRNRPVPHLALDVRSGCPMVVKGLAIAGHLSSRFVDLEGVRERPGG